MRRLPKFNYFRPESFEEAVRLLREHRGRIRAFAGGTDLFVAMKEKGVTFENVLDLKGIRGSDSISRADGTIEIGALASIRSVETSPLIREMLPFLSEAAGKLGSVQVRNRATIGGNICNASPAAETAPALIALGAQVEIIGEKGPRAAPLEKFFLGPGRSILEETELVTKILLPPLPPNSGGAYLKYGPRRAMDIAVVGVGCVLTLDSGKKKCLDSRILLGAVAPIPLRANMAEAAVNGTEVTEREIEEAGERAKQEARPITDIRGSAEHRAERVKVFVRRSLREALRVIRAA